MNIFIVFGAVVKQICFFLTGAFGLVVATTKAADSSRNLLSIFRRYIIKVFMNSFVGKLSRRHVGGSGRGVGKGRTWRAFLKFTFSLIG